MIKLLVLAGLFAVVLAAPQNPADAAATILKYDSDNIGVDGYRYAYETSNGISANEEGELKNAGTDNEAISVRGSYSFIAPDGQTYTITYIADENGFQPEGAHIPKAL